MRFFVFLILTITAIAAAQADTVLSPFTSQEHGHLFSLQGSNTVGARLAPELARDYMEAKGLINVSVRPTAVENEYQVIGYHKNTNQPFMVDLAAHGSSTAFTALAAGRAEIGMASRAIKPEEIEMLHRLGDMKSFEAEKVIAIDGLAIIVHPRNKISQLTIDEIGKIFAGEIDDWRQLGGAPGKITLYARDHNSGTWDTFKSLVLQKAYKLHPSAERFESNDEISRLVRNNENAIGFVGLASVGETKALAVADNNTRALLPTVLSVATEDYPLARRLFMYVSPENQSLPVREFLEFVQSATGQERVNSVGYIAQTPIGLPSKNLDGAPPQYRELVRNGERLSINIRFKDGSADLDNKARQDVLRLSRYMQKTEQQNRQLLLIGFGDTKQTDQRAHVLSKLRAMAVAFALRDKGLSDMTIRGLGDDLPIADNGSDNRVKNQRVEIWMI